MTQKDKVKELVGRGLHSYHTKALQQMDRIEKKNKEQNHKISILTNELDNDYLTKTEEGSVVSLEHSKEGMVYLDELQGNTLVNYCTDGSKELTLNGDIDVEGTFVTTTEGVDNGKVDVMCEGNTLVNLCKLLKVSNNIAFLDNPTRICGTVTIINAFKANNIYVNRYNMSDGTYAGATLINSNVFKLDIPTGQYVGQLYDNTSTDFISPSTLIEDVLILEGDWTDREIPPYFEGMQSVGQDDENGHKIEFLSQTQNLVDDFSKYKKINSSVTFTKINNHSFSVEGNGEHTWQQVNFNIPFIQNAKSGDTFTLFAEEITLLNQDTSSDIGIQMRNTTLNMSISNSWQVNANKPIRNGLIKFTIPNNYNGTDILDLRVHINHNVALANKVTIKNLMIAKGHVDISSFKPYGLNKKEILLNEPLRGVNEVKDRFVRIGGKCYTERNYYEYTLNSEDSWSLSECANGEKFFALNKYSLPIPNGGTSLIENQICNRFKFGNPYMGESDCLWVYTPDEIMDYVTLRVRITSIEQTVSAFKDWLKNNPTVVVYRLRTPIYEPLEIEPTLNTYNDVTHISNNSIIPCNMKIQNSGYNAIIKPSTLYTVSLDTNKSGTIGMNLGGAKGTTTNNVLKLTTPATLTDDSLRLYGKGIKGSKVRLLEGDKTNWIPSHFEGMKSSFEDKFDTTDNTYKMEILSNNKNYFNYKGELNQYYKGMAIGTEVNINTLQSDGGIFSNLFTANHHGRGQIIKVKPYTNYIIKSTVVNSGRININTPSMVNFEYGTALNGKLNKTFNTLNNNEICLSFHTVGNSSNPNAIFYDVELILESNDNLDYIPNKSNKIQFSSIEPLRSLPSGVKDKFIFKDGKLMIERNTSKTKITSDMNFTRSYEGWANIVFACEVDGLIPIDISTKNVYCNVLPSFSIADLCNALGKTGIASHGWVNNKCLQIAINGIDTVDNLREWISERDMEIVYQIEPTYEEIPFELQKIILEGYENGTLFFDTNIPPTSTVTYAGETPIVKATKLNKTEVLNNTNDINDNIVPYLMDMDYRVVCLQLESNIEGISMSRLFGGAYEMLKRDILSKRLTKEEYGYRLTDYFNAGKLTEQEVRELEDLI